jgi:hypothetical protein
MRYDKPIYFQRITQGDYNPATANYGSDTIEEDEVYADVTDAGVDTLKLIYGELRQGALVIRLQNHYDKTFNRIRVGDKKYRVDFSRKLRTKHVFVVSEVQ